MYSSCAVSQKLQHIIASYLFFYYTSRYTETLDNINYSLAWEKLNISYRVKSFTDSE